MIVIKCIVGQMDVDRLDVDLSWLSRQNNEVLKNYMNPTEFFYVSYLIEKLMEFRPSSQEITYMLTVFSFRFAAKTLKGEFEQISESIIEELADDLHSYYINENKLKNYASRITRMMKIINYLKSDIHERREKLKMAQLFDLITVDFSHPEMMFGKKQH